MAQTTDYFTIEDQGDVRVLRLRPLEKIVFGHFDAMQNLFELLEGLHRRRQKVLLIEVQPGVLSPDIVDAFWEAARSEPPVRGGRREPPRRPTIAFLDAAIERLLPRLQTLETIVVATFQGEVDLDLFGTLLVCDYRICSDDTVLVNRVLERGSPPGSALFWLLCRYVGYGAAQEILIEGRSLTASEARQLRLVNRVVPADSLAAEGITVATDLSAKPAVAIGSLKRTCRYVDKDLVTYLKNSGTGFDSLPG
jgi:enoyl-CoA hydratase/carnithine racemase